MEITWQEGRLDDLYSKSHPDAGLHPEAYSHEDAGSHPEAKLQPEAELLEEGNSHPEADAQPEVNALELVE